MDKKKDPIFLWCYLFNLLKIKVNKINKLMPQTYAAHVEDTTEKTQ